MLKVNFFHICEDTIIEEKTGNMSLISVFDKINATSFPSKYPSVTFVGGVDSDLASQEIEIMLEISDSKEEVLRCPVKVKIGANGKANFIQRLVNYPLPNELTHEIKVIYKDEVIYTKHLTINNSK